MKVHQSIAALCLTALLSACGGGSGGGVSGSSSTTLPPTESPGTIAARNQSLTITNLDLKVSDIVGTTNSSVTTVGMIREKTLKYTDKILNLFITSAYAQSLSNSYPKTITAQAIPVSRKLIDGRLVKFNPTVKYYEKNANGNLIEKTVACDFSTAEVNIKSMYKIDANTDDLLVIMDVPSQVNQDCSLTYKAGTFLVFANGNTYDVSSSFPTGVLNIVPAHDPGFNSSDNPLLIDHDVVRMVNIKLDGTLTLTELTSKDAPVLANGSSGYSPGSITYNGRYLMGSTSQSTASNATYLIYEKDKTEFRIFKPGSNGSQGWNMNSYLTSILDDQGNFLFHSASDKFNQLNTADLTYIPMNGPVIDTYNNGVLTTSSFPPHMFGAVGRYDKWIMSDRGVLWNYGDGRRMSLSNFPSTNLDTSIAGGMLPSYARLFGNYAYFVDQDKSNFIRYDLIKNTGININLSQLGYLPKDFIVFKTTAMVEIVNSANSDRKYVEINFDTGVVSERGVITQGGRKMDTFVPLSGT